MPTHAYHRTLTTKILCAGKLDRNVAVTTFPECQEIIRRMHAATAGCPQIVYLVGWQHRGHDTGYPDWSVVNPLCAPGEDAAEALRRLMREARAFNAAVSLHINMDDAYDYSPLWDEYVRRDLLVRDAAGKVVDGDIWDGERSHWVCKSREWASGLSRRRIEALCAFLPVREAGSIHIDAFRPVPSPGHRTTWDDEAAACRAIVGCWNALGIDVTTEYLADPAFADLHPMVFHDQRDEHQRLAIPPEVVCGGGAAWASHRHRTVKDGAPGWWGAFCSPGAGCRRPEAWGNSIDSDLGWRSRDDGPLSTATAARLFHRDSLPWLRMNRSRPVRFCETVEHYTVEFADGLVSEVGQGDGRHRIHDQGRLILDSGDRCIEAAWTAGGSIACHAQGGRRTWDLGPAWAGIGRAALSLLDPEGRRSGGTLPVRNGSIDLDLPPALGALITPD